jgi:SAM-dependent methyltransferase
LVARGVQVHGVDASEQMVAVLRSKPGGADIPVTMGDFADVPVTGSYRLIYVVYNSFNNLLTQEDEVRCFENVAAHLTDDGSFLIEAGVPNSLHRVFENQYVHAESIGVDEVWLDVGRRDPVTQRHEETHVRLSAEGVRLYPIVQRYTWPSELDLMARIAGLRLKERWDGWNREPFTSTGNVVSVYGR